jgi:hypothetical protein
MFVLASSCYAGPAKLRYEFKNGGVYQVNIVQHNKGESAAKIGFGGDQKVMETPIDDVRKSSWVIKSSRIGGGVMQLTMDYAKDQNDSSTFAGSHAVVDIDPQKGMINIVTKPDDSLTRAVYEPRFAWLPSLPVKALKPDDSFTSDYKVKGELVSMKGCDEYVLDEISNGIAYFTLESKLITINHISAMPKMENLPEVFTMPKALDWTLVYKGEGTAVFDLQEGIFIEREILYRYGQKGQNSGMGVTMNNLRGTIKQRCEMERR